ncbi:MAG TPA: hypothetical protein VG537_09715 [Candidatus Kapabacteria bacterium]|jgi:hypothetical protein|nr:hypothetical protein [Candidatus Kapabacteria bacterium]
MLRIVPAGLLLATIVLLFGCSPATTSYNVRPPYDDANIPPGMRDTLWDDAARLALNKEIAADSSFIDSVTIPQDRIQFYYTDLVKLYNVQRIPARDSIFGLYRVQPIEPELHLVVAYGPGFFENLSDSMKRQMEARFDLDSVPYAPVRLHSRVPCNAIALAKEMQREFPNLLIDAEGYGSTGGCFSDIYVSDSVDSRFYTYRYCLENAGYHDWYFSVDDSGRVLYRGSDGDPIR